MLADLGADVVRVERPGYVPDESGPTALLGRSTVTADLTSADDACEVLELVDLSDVLIEGFAQGSSSGPASGRRPARRATPASSTSG